MNWQTGLSMALLILAGISSTARAQSIQENPFWVIQGATLIDGTGGPPIPMAVIIGRNEKILCAGAATSCQIPEGAAIVKADGKWVIPGLIDTHVHLGWNSDETRASRAQLTRLAFGITTTREAGTPGNLQTNLDRRRQANLPTSPEPRLVVSALVSDENMRTYGARDVADLVGKLAQQGADAIKIKQAFSDQELTDVIKEARAHNLPVFGHTWSATKPSLTPALAAGVDGLSHMATFSVYGQRGDAARPPQPGGIDSFVWNSEQWNYQDEARLAAVSETAASQGTWIEPMLAVEKNFTLPYPPTDGFDYLGEIPSLRGIVRPWIPAGDWGWPAVRSRRRKIDVAYRHICEFVSGFHARGGIVITGTDDLQPGPSLAEEVKLLTGCGFTAIEALQSATKYAAAALNRADLGTIEADKAADLVILNGDPLLLPANLLHVWRVVKGGHLYDPADLLKSMISDYQDQARKTRFKLVAGFAGATLLAGVCIVAYRRFRRRTP